MILSITVITPAETTPAVPPNTTIRLLLPDLRTFINCKYNKTLQKVALMKTMTGKLPASCSFFFLEEILLCITHSRTHVRLSKTNNTVFILLKTVTFLLRELSREMELV